MSNSDDIARAEEVRLFLSSPGGQFVMEVLTSRIDLALTQREHSADRTLGALIALQDAISAIYGIVSVGEQARIRAERASKSEIEYERKQRVPKGMPVPQRHTNDGI